MCRSVPCPIPLIQCPYNTLPLCCVFIFSSLFIVQVFFFVGLGVSLSRGLCWFISGVAVGIQCDTWCSPVDLLNVSQAGLELVSGGRGALLFLSVMWCVEAFYRQRFGVMTF
jgi:hypothetical protein